MNLKERLFLYEASRWIGTSEIGGNNKGQLVERFRAAIKGTMPGSSWCASFVHFCINAVDGACDAADLIGQKSKIYKSASCMEIWSNSPMAIRSTFARQGNLIVWQKYDGDEPTQFGQIGIVADDLLENNTLKTIEANVPDKITPSVDSVQTRYRSPIKDGKLRVLGFLKPWS